MQYLILALGVIAGIYGLYIFLTRANIKQIMTLIMAILFLVMIITLVFMAITGKLAAALTMLVAIWPFGLGLYRTLKNPYNIDLNKARKSASTSSDMTEDQALDILGLKKGASQDDIEKAYKRLMKKVHPDQDGSHGLAEKLNQARDLLTKR